MIALGGWFFRNRGWLPVPMLIAMFTAQPRFVFGGVVVIALGQALRLWAVGHIGLPSRTRDTTTPHIVEAGPYGLVRNPLYIGNILLFGGLGIALWPWVLIVVPILSVYYAIMVRWEEQNLESRLGEPYRGYRGRVPRWFPKFAPITGDWDWAVALRSERSTFLAVTVVLGTLGWRSLSG